MFKIKLTPYRPELGAIYHRQTKGHTLQSSDGRYQFYLDDEIDEADFWVVQGKGVRHTQSCHVAPQNTIFLATEPRSVLTYPQKYLQQFGHICTCQEETKQKKYKKSLVHYSPAILPWFIGCKEDNDGVVTYSMDYDMLKKQPSPQKPKLISVISSNKAFTQGHIDRIRFVRKLKDYFGDKVDIFGRGENPFDDKWDVIAPYKYHIVIENSSQRYYWTEKLGDCYLAEAFPFYYGCTNLTDYFPNTAFEYIDIKNPDRAIEIIQKQIEADRYKNAQQILKQCKEKMLDEYNIFDFIAKLCSTLDATLPKQSTIIEPCKSSKSLINLWNYTIGRNYYNTKAKLYV
ncbi:MAG: glycosyltransferase family 10 [Bacteroidaceae bacterium]|nr:glycosyltransferase family 10 [Bacteroidaceae bacterium]